MKILVIGETHGSRQDLFALLNYETYDRVVFLGNYVSDFESLGVKYKFPPVVVRGFCDSFHKNPYNIKTKIGGFSFYITNGFKYDTKKSGVVNLVEYAQNNNINCVLYADNPNDKILCQDGIWYINPGAFGITHSGRRTYAILDVGNDGFKCKICEFAFDDM